MPAGNAVRVGKRDRGLSVTYDRGVEFNSSEEYKIAGTLSIAEMGRPVLQYCAKKGCDKCNTDLAERQGEEFSVQVCFFRGLSACEGSKVSFAACLICQSCLGCCVNLYVCKGCTAPHYLLHDVDSLVDCSCGHVVRITKKLRFNWYCKGCRTEHSRNLKTDHQSHCCSGLMQTTVVLVVCSLGC